MSPIRLLLREKRQASGLSQQALADRVGVRVATISDLERREPRRIDLDLVDRLAKALGCTAIDLLTEVPQPRAKK